MQFRTRAIHVGQEADPSNGAVVPPIHLASTFVLPTANGDDAQYDYARTGAPTRHAVEAVMASFQGVRPRLVSHRARCSASARARPALRKQARSFSQQAVSLVLVILYVQEVMTNFIF